MTGRYREFHQQGRWRGLPVRVEDTDERPRFVPISNYLTQHSALSSQDFPEPATRDPRPDILMLGVPNAGMMVGQPTNVFLLGYVLEDNRSLTLVDCGASEGFPVVTEALATTGIPIDRIGQIVLTHCHPDHVGNAAAIKRASGARVWAHPLERTQIERFGEGLEIDSWLVDDQVIEADGFTLQTILTPGHSPGHVCVVEPASRVLLAGDMISGFGSVGIFPPSGSMAAYITSLQRLLATHNVAPFSLVCPGHGPIIADAGAKIGEYIEHRLQREEEIYRTISTGISSIDELLPVIYPDVQPHLARAARSTLQAHLDKLEAEGEIIQIADDRYATAGD